MTYWDRFDICEAWYVYAMLHHGGQWSPEYRIFGRLDAMRFRPRPSLNDETSLSENGREIYAQLVAKEEQSS